jgi:hypothetical protein
MEKIMAYVYPINPSIPEIPEAVFDAATFDEPWANGEKVKRFDLHGNEVVRITAEWIVTSDEVIFYNHGNGFITHIDRAYTDEI